MALSSSSLLPGRGDLLARTRASTSWSAGDPFDQHLDLATGFLDAPQPRRDDARVIEYQQVTAIRASRGNRKTGHHAVYRCPG